MSVVSRSIDCCNCPLSTRADELATGSPKETLKVMRLFLSKLKLLIIDEVSMVSSLNMAYIHLRLDVIFAKDEWFGGVNVLFVGDIL